MVPPESLAWVRKRIVAGACGDQGPPMRRRLYISRAGTGHRQILNEGELMECLHECEFEIVRPEGLSFDEQVDCSAPPRSSSALAAPRSRTWCLRNTRRSWSSPPMSPSPAPCTSAWPIHSGTSITTCSAAARPVLRRRSRCIPQGARVDARRLSTDWSPRPHVGGVDLDADSLRDQVHRQHEASVAALAHEPSSQATERTGDDLHLVAFLDEGTRIVAAARSRPVAGFRRPRRQEPTSALHRCRRSGRHRHT